VNICKYIHCTGLLVLLGYCLYNCCGHTFVDFTDCNAPLFGESRLSAYFISEIPYQNLKKYGTGMVKFIFHSNRSNTNFTSINLKA
jgi:hypothetical protein